MDIVILQDIKLIQRNPLESYTVINENQKGKLRKKSYSPLQKKRIKYFSPKERKSYMQETIKH